MAVQRVEPRPRRRRVEVDVDLLDVFAVIALRPAEPEQPLLEDRVAFVPEGDGEAQPTPFVADPEEPVLGPAIGARAGVIVREIAPRVAAGRVVLADRAPRPIREIRAPQPPGHDPLAPLAQADSLGIERGVQHARTVDLGDDGGMTTLAGVALGENGDDDPSHPNRRAAARGRARGPLAGAARHGPGDRRPRLRRPVGRRAPPLPLARSGAERSVGSLDAHGCPGGRDDALLPRPRPGGPPLLIGSNGPRMLRIALSHAHAWNTWYADTNNTPAGVAPLRAVVDDACRDVGRDPAAIKRTVAVQVRLPG